MRYDSERDLITVSVRELVSTARRKISSTPPYDIDEPSTAQTNQKNKRSGNSEIPDLVFDFSLEGYNFRIVSADICEEDGSLIKTVLVDTSPKHPQKEVLAQARGEGYITAYIIAKSRGLESVNLTFVYRSRITEEENTVCESVSIKNLEKFFSKCIMSIKVYAKPEIERVTVRLPLMKKVKFPFDKVRDGQSDLVRNVYKNVARGGRLFISAPTGTGKTVSVLFPAIRAMGEGRCEKVFYFTPKTTTAEAAVDTVSNIAGENGGVRAVVIASKERLCQNKLICHESRTRCENSKNNSIADAVLSIYNDAHTVVTPKMIAERAKEYKICPYELSLSYAELCDVIILDVNYLFDPTVYIRRFFDERREYAFLIDEAHNLPERAREMYSATICERELVAPALSPILSEHSRTKKAARVASEELSSLFMPYLSDDIIIGEDGIRKGAAHLSEIPSHLYEILDTLIPTVEEEIFQTRISKDEEAEARTILLKEYYYKVKKFYEAVLRFDGSYELFVFLSGNEITLRVFCIDPAGEISKRLDIGGCAVFFSGTLSPMHYYKSVLGADRSAEVIETESPFDSGQLSVTIIDSISTRLSERERTLDAVCKMIAATVSAKRGNYMIFSPSFSYSEALASAFRRRYPKINVLSQTRDMTRKEKEDFLSQFRKEDKSYLIGFSVLGGIYSEGVDFSGESLIGAVIVGIGIPAISYEREAMAAYYQDRFEEGKEFAYIYPGINKVLQAAGRIIRGENDKGALVLIDDRFDDPLYKTVMPRLWSDMQFLKDPKALRERLDDFWRS